MLHAAVCVSRILCVTWIISGTYYICMLHAHPATSRICIYNLCYMLEHVLTCKSMLPCEERVSRNYSLHVWVCVSCIICVTWWSVCFMLNLCHILECVSSTDCATWWSVCVMHNLCYMHVCVFQAQCVTCWSVCFTYNLHYTLERVFHALTVLHPGARAACTNCVTCWSMCLMHFCVTCWKAFHALNVLHERAYVSYITCDTCIICYFLRCVVHEQSTLHGEVCLMHNLS